jgi:class 3 adenylate cyclase
VATPRAQPFLLALLLALPLLGFSLLLAAPGADVRWEHHPSHFWLVLTAGVASAGLAFATSSAATRRADARLHLVSLSLLAAAGFLGLHALATPGVLLDSPNQGFVIATPAGLLLAAVLAAASAVPLDRERSDRIARAAGTLRAALVAAMAIWAVVSLASVPPLDDPTPAERASGALVVPAALGVVLFGYAAARYLRLGMRTRGALPIAVGAAFVLLAEAMIAVAFARNWHASWWEWHALMLAAFVTVAWSARAEPADERFSDLYLEQTAAGKREVSVLFADLAGFTSFSEGRDPREVQDMLNAYFEVAIPPIVRRFGGQIDRLIGDAIMATWGTRGDQPDHARRAAAAALELQRETAGLAAEHPDWPRFRVGVNSGEALVGVIGTDTGRSYTVLGDTVNAASRLEAQAPVGGVVIGGTTLTALDAALATPLGRLEVKGRRAPVEAYVLESLP